jgi:uncharacterized membrane protein
MNPYSILHVIAALAALVIGLLMLALRKGDRRHRVLGWWYVALMSIGLIGIVIRTWGRPHPFMGYAVMILIVLSTAVGASRYRSRVPTWRAWHGALMSLTIMGAVIAASSIVGGVIIGNGSGAPFYQMFNILIAVGTVAGLGVINTRRIVWGRANPEKVTRRWYSVLVVGSSTALIAAQWGMAFP